MGKKSLILMSLSFQTYRALCLRYTTTPNPNHCDHLKQRWWKISHTELKILLCYLLLSRSAVVLNVTQCFCC